MYIKNTQNKDVKLASFEGYQFTIPPGVVWIYDKAGEHLIKTYAPIGEHGKMHQTSQGLVFMPGKSPVSVITNATEEGWDKGGRRLAEVKRFQINAKMIPKNKLIITAQQRGIPNDRLMEYQMDSSIDVETIASDINNLPVPESMRFPSNLETEINE